MDCGSYGSGAVDETAVYPEVRYDGWGYGVTAGVYTGGVCTSEIVAYGVAAVIGSACRDTGGSEGSGAGSLVGVGVTPFSAGIPEGPAQPAQKSMAATMQHESTGNERIIGRS
jgi:hypothetical protein